MPGLRGIVVASLILGVVGCNDGQLASAPLAEETPTPEPAPTFVPNSAPVAIIENAPAGDLSPLDTLPLAGASSYDPDGTPIAAWTWDVVASPSGSTAVPLSVSPNFENIEFFVDLAGDYTLRLTVFDELGASGSAEVTFSAVPPQDFHVELTWDVGGSSDVDLHVIDRSAGGTFESSPFDCYYSNPTPVWGAAGALDDPRLDLDDTTGFGPENVNIDLPQNGAVYRVIVHYYSAAGQGATVARIRLYLGGVLVLDESQNLSATDKAWRAFDVAWPSGTITLIDEVFDA